MIKTVEKDYVCPWNEFKKCYENRCPYWCETSWDNFSADEAADAWNRRADNG